MRLNDISKVARSTTKYGQKGWNIGKLRYDYHWSIHIREVSGVRILYDPLVSISEIGITDSSGGVS